MHRGEPADDTIPPSTLDQAWNPGHRARRKRASRRLRNDLRVALPLLALVFCFALSATAIFTTEWLPAAVGSPPAVAAAPPPSFECGPLVGQAISTDWRDAETTNEDARVSAATAATSGLPAARPRR